MDVCACKVSCPEWTLRVGRVKRAHQQQEGGDRERGGLGIGIGMGSSPSSSSSFSSSSSSSSFSSDVVSATPLPNGFRIVLGTRLLPEGMAERSEDLKRLRETTGFNATRTSAPASPPEFVELWPGASNETKWLRLTRFIAGSRPGAAAPDETASSSSSCFESFSATESAEAANAVRSLLDGQQAPVLADLATLVWNGDGEFFELTSVPLPPWLAVIAASAFATAAAAAQSASGAHSPAPSRAALSSSGGASRPSPLIGAPGPPSLPGAPGPPPLTDRGSGPPPQPPSGAPGPPPLSGAPGPPPVGAPGPPARAPPPSPPAALTLATIPGASPSCLRVDGVPVQSSCPLPKACILWICGSVYYFLAHQGAEARISTRKRKSDGSQLPGLRDSKIARLGAKSAPDEIRNEFPEFDECDAVLQRLSQFKDAWPFLQAVDPIELGIPDYFDIIKRPMDLGTVSDKLGTGRYSSAEAVRSDLQLIWDNAKTYNRKGDPVFQLAVNMEQRFQKQWDSLLRKSQKLQEEWRPDSSDASGDRSAESSAATRGQASQRNIEKETEFINKFGLWTETQVDVAEEVGEVVERRDGSSRVVRKHALPGLPPGSKYYKPSRVDATGQPLMPLTTKNLTVFDLGQIVQKTAFHSKRYIWPVGYRSQREGPSYKYPGRATVYLQEILDGGNEPVFRITPGDDHEGAITHASSTGGWRDILDRIQRETGSGAKGSSGPEQFGFVHPNILAYIQRLPGAQKLKKYEPVTFIEKPE